MALDTLSTKAICDELDEELSGGRIEKIYQPEKDEITLSIKSINENKRLVISANSSQPRIHYTKVQKENPKTAPLFCMLLRKHLQGGKIIKVQQVDMERIVRIDVESRDELGDLTIKHLFCEIMGRNSNIILTKNDLTIIDSIKHIDFTVSTVRQLLPGLKYCLPPKQEKVAILSKDIKDFSDCFLGEGITAEKVIMNEISGISMLVAREIVYRAINKTGVDISQISTNEREKIMSETKKVLEYTKKPCIISDKTTGSIIDFCVFDIFQYGDSCDKLYYNKVCDMLDEFYYERDKNERMKQKSADLMHILSVSTDRVAKKIAILKKTILDAKRKEEYKIKGDLLTANVYRIKPGDESVTVENFYQENQEKITISLNPTISPSDNAQRYYKLYKKSKNAQTEATRQLDLAIADLQYLESTLILAKNATDEEDLNAIRQELSDLGYQKQRKTKLKSKEKNTSKPHHFISGDGFDIYVGKNNTQNDYLTLKFANTMDLWFHTKNIHGSHTVIKLGVDKQVPNSTIKEAAILAAYYSKGRDSSNVPVDYTFIKNVKKPKGAKPGMVIYEGYNTIYVTPSEDEVSKIKQVNS